MADELDRPDALPYSALVALFGDLFVEGRGGWALPWREARVDERRLASEALAAALVGMAREGHLYLSVALRKGLLRKEEAALVERGARKPRGQPGGLEGRLWKLLSEGEPAQWADDLARAAAGGGTPYPEFMILSRVMDHLTDQGYFSRRRRGGFELKVAGIALARPSYELEPNSRKIQACEAQAREARESLEAFASRNALLWKKLHGLI